MQTRVKIYSKVTQVLLRENELWEDMRDVGFGNTRLVTWGQGDILTVFSTGFRGRVINPKTVAVLVDKQERLTELLGDGEVPIVQ